jgi:hypothetical protein
MKKAAGIASSLCFALLYPVAPGAAAPSCPDVDAARAMLEKAAAAKNDEDLKQMPRNVPPPGQPAQQGRKAPQNAKGNAQPQPGTQSHPGQPEPQEAAQQDQEPPPNVETAPVPEDLKRAALLVKQADDACQAGNGAEASERAKAAMALMKR